MLLCSRSIQTRPKPAVFAMRTISVVRALDALAAFADPVGVRRAEAQGVADANRIIAGSLTNSYLSWYYIEMLKNVANSQNNTFVITPFDQKLIPMLNVGK